MKKIEFITAGAGSGKTYTLTHRLANILQSGQVRPSEIIVTTFTKAAAAEIRDRARQVLLEQGLVLQAAQLDSAAIGTIHGVAQQLVNTYWYQLGAAPHADLITDEDKRIYRNRSLGQLVEDRQYSPCMQAINAYYKRFCPKKTDARNTPKPNPEFWVEDVERIVGKHSYYQLQDYQESLRESLASVDWLTLLSAEDRQLMKDCIRAVFQLAEAWVQRYEDFKHRMGVIDYDDMERGLRSLLHVESVRQEIAQRYKLVMVDEFQDCNPIQLEIFSELSDIIAPTSPLEQSSIWVGDPKQAIYGFRGADLELVRRVAAQFPPVGEPADANGLKSSSLDTSFRTREPLVSLANELFAPRFTGMTPLKSHRGQVVGMHPSAVQVWGATDSNAADRMRVIARHLKELVASGQYQVMPKDEQQLRPLQYDDIAFLAATQSHISQIVEALRAEDIPVWAPEVDILPRAEVQLVLSLLQVLASAKEDHEWASLLKLWADLSTEQVFARRLDFLDASQPDASWIDSLPELQPLRLALHHAQGLPLDQAMASLILELGLYDRVAKWGEAEVRRQNLKTLQQQAQSFMARCHRLDILPIVSEFISYLSEVDIPRSKEMPKGSVKVVTYHGSKGLEWPMVILCSLDYKRTTMIVEREVQGVHEQQTSDLQDYYLHYLPGASDDLQKAIKDLGIDKWPIAEEARQRLTEEGLRLLYVGFTRARDYVVLALQQKAKGYSHAWLDSVEMTIGDFQPQETHHLEPRQPKAPTEPDRPKEKARQATIEKYKVAYAQYQADLAKYEAAQLALQAEAEASQEPRQVVLPAFPELCDQQPDARFVQPSRLTRMLHATDVPVKIAQIASGIEVAGAVDDTNEDPQSKSSLGTCIHKIFASCTTDGSAPTADQRTAFVAQARQILERCGQTQAIPHPEQLAEALFALHAWLTQTYGPAIRGIEREYPFCYTWGEGQVITGEMDLLWRTEQGDVLIDFKNHQQDDDLPVGAPCPHSSHYRPQLQAYRHILQQAGHTVLDTLLYYDLQGYLIRIPTAE